ncbi:MAG: hypothetical protein WC464_06650, partial [Bdellovibrionales bacterium]
MSRQDFQNLSEETLVTPVAESVPGNVPVPETKLEAEPPLEPETKLNPEPELDLEQELDPQKKAKPEPKTDAEPEKKSEPKPELPSKPVSKRKSASKKRKKKKQKWPGWIMPTAIILFICVIVEFLVLHEVNTSEFQAAALSSIGRNISFEMQPGENPHMRYPKSGPYNERLGYSFIPFYIKALQGDGFVVTAQAQTS